ncbi:MAG: GldG family protein [Candidatus Eisenbacteria bacterium]|uniref:GldG family protein n=1 Tax=Eiseniibacteriota bacterium TaxID=2212470 RepID=A0A948W5C9_UNCEI|nr:GldG family protein [Candidatus Eisenbacteria bacterium]MBU1948965.1 GldG family protein [Candidatus Eisenbacteria bacterium]MBU2693172.1 GldG family protein [Candidatus Eisenbacteria bacterium]
MKQTRPFVLLLISCVIVLLGVLWSALHNGHPGFPGRLLWITGGAGFLFFLVRTGDEIRFFILHLRSFSEPGLMLTLLLACGFLILGSIAVERSGLRWDLTRQKIYTLKPGSHEIVNEIQNKVEMIAFLKEGTSTWREAGELLGIYVASSRKIEMRRVDPDQDPATARKYGVGEVGLILLRSGDREERVTDLSEQALTAGLIRLISGKGRSILFSRGHEELSPSAVDPTGLSKLTRFLSDDGYQVGVTDLLDPAHFPDPPGVVVIAGPRHDLIPGEIRNLQEFLDRGGRAAIFLDPGVKTELSQPFLSSGIILGDGPIELTEATSKRLGLDEGQILADPTNDHPASSYLGTRALLVGARPVESSEPGRQISESSTLLRTLAGQGGEAPADPSYSVAVASAWQIHAPDDNLTRFRERPWARLIVVGDSDLLTNRYLERQGNRQVVMSFIHWLAEEDILLRSEAKQQQPVLLLDETIIRTLWLIMMILLPLAFLLLGITIWLRRRSVGRG